MRKFFLLLFCIMLLVSAQGESKQVDGTDTIAELSKTSLTSANGNSLSGQSVVSKKRFIALYFSAHWCGPCRAFTPELVKFRDQCVKKGLPFEVIFISLDKSKKEMMNYMKGENMKWPALPYSSPLRETLKSRYHAYGIPRLVLLDGSGKVVSENARNDVHFLGFDAYKRWQSPDYKPVSSSDYCKTKPEDKTKKIKEYMERTPVEKKNEAKKSEKKSNGKKKGNVKKSTSRKAN